MSTFVEFTPKVPFDKRTLHQEVEAVFTAAYLFLLIISCAALASALTKSKYSTLTRDDWYMQCIWGAFLVLVCVYFTTQSDYTYRYVALAYLLLSLMIDAYHTFSWQYVAQRSTITLERRIYSVFDNIVWVVVVLVLYHA